MTIKDTIRIWKVSVVNNNLAMAEDDENDDIKDVIISPISTLTDLENSGKEYYLPGVAYITYSDRTDDIALIVAKDNDTILEINSDSVIISEFVYNLLLESREEYDEFIEAILAEKFDSRFATLYCKL